MKDKLKKLIIPIIFLITLISIISIAINKDILNIDKNEQESNNRVDLIKVDKIAEYKYDYTIKCEAFEKEIKYFKYYNDTHEGWIVNTDNSVYKFNSYNLYSNDTNCIKLDEQFPNVKQIVRDFELGITTYYNEEYQEIYISDDNSIGLIGDYENNALGYNSLLQQKSKWDYLTENGYKKIQTTQETLAIKGDNTIYGILLTNFNFTGSGEPESPYRFYIYNETPILTLDSDETIIDFYYTPNIRMWLHGNGEGHYNETKIENEKPNNFILTDKSYYRYKLVDDRCLKYIDIECAYELVKDEELTKYKDDILYRDEFMMIISNGRVFNSYSDGL